MSKHFKNEMCVLLWHHHIHLWTLWLIWKVVFVQMFRKLSIFFKALSSPALLCSQFSSSSSLSSSLSSSSSSFALYITIVIIIYSSLYHYHPHKANFSIFIIQKPATFIIKKIAQKSQRLTLKIRSTCWKMWK